jgi:hypothetical protein
MARALRGKYSFGLTDWPRDQHPLDAPNRKTLDKNTPGQENTGTGKRQE